MKTMFDVGDRVLVLATVMAIHIDDEHGIRYKVDMMDGENPWGDIVNFSIPECAIKEKAND